MVVIGIAGTTIYYTSYKPTLASDWITDGVDAGCQAGIKNEYGFPISLICPSILENLTLAPVQFVWVSKNGNLI